jgi:hypothetical protein
MSITLDIPEDLESELSEEAHRLGLSLSDYAVQILSTGLTLTQRPKTGAELVDYWNSQGLVGTRPDISDSQAHARRLRERAERRTSS